VALKTALITITHPGTSAKTAEKLVFRLTNVLVSSLKETANTNGSTETVGLQAEKIAMNYDQGGKVITTVGIVPIGPAE
jgi:type VI protein secretion system component Hcp